MAHIEQCQVSHSMTSVVGVIYTLFHEKTILAPSKNECNYYSASLFFHCPCVEKGAQNTKHQWAPEWFSLDMWFRKGQKPLGICSAETIAKK